MYGTVTKHERRAGCGERTAMKVIACRVMIDEMRGFLPAGVEAVVFEISQHVHPKQLKAELQAAIDRLDGSCETILLGYGLCSNAVLGLVSRSARLVLPRIHDCIGVFLGSHKEYLREMGTEPAFFLTQGYIRGYQSDGSGPMAEFERVAERHGTARAERLMGKLMSAYKRLVYIRTDQALDIEADRAYAHQMAELFHMRYEERAGTSELLRRMIAGDWNTTDFVVVEPGEAVALEHFWS
jgi:hypothetical protein